METQKPAKTRGFPSPEEAFQQKSQTFADHIPKRARVLFRKASSNSLSDRALASLWPWAVWEYPGKGRLRQWLMGASSVASAERFRRKLPKIRAAVIGQRLRAKAAELVALAAECEAYAARPDKPGNFISRKVPRVHVAPPHE